MRNDYSVPYRLPLVARQERSRKTGSSSLPASILADLKLSANNNKKNIIFIQRFRVNTTPQPLYTKIRRRILTQKAEILGF